MTSVPRHSPHVLASACAGGLRRHVDCSGQGVDRDDELGHNHLQRFSANLLIDEHGEAPDAAANGLHAPETGHVSVGYAKHVRHLVTLVHIGDPLRRPRAISHWDDRVGHTTSDDCSFRTKVRAVGYPRVKPAAEVSAVTL
jgi:hypothetical protein